MKRVNENLEIFLGFFIFILANILAFGYSYNKFYSIFVVGMFLILKGTFTKINNKEFLDTKKFIKVYLAFLVLGIIADLILGIYITKLWYYPNYSLINYIFLYLLVYPFGGFIMIYSFAIIESLFYKKIKYTKKQNKISFITSLLIFIFGFIGIIFSFLLISNYKGFFIYVFCSMSGYGLTNYIILRIKNEDLLKKLLTKTLKYSLLILFIGYTQGILSELPNIFAREWIYQNFPLGEITILGIPVLVLFLGWLALILVPYSIFELIIALNIKGGKDGG